MPNLVPWSTGYLTYVAHRLDHRHLPEVFLTDFVAREARYRATVEEVHQLLDVPATSVQVAIYEMVVMEGHLPGAISASGETDLALVIGAMASLSHARTAPTRVVIIAPRDGVRVLDDARRRIASVIGTGTLGRNLLDRVVVHDAALPPLSRHVLHGAEVLRMAMSSI